MHLTYAVRKSQSSFITIFFHPDCTVGFGVSPNHALRLVGCTTGRELHPALKILFNFYTVYYNLSQVLVKTNQSISQGNRIKSIYNCF